MYTLDHLYLAAILGVLVGIAVGIAIVLQIRRGGDDS